MFNLLTTPLLFLTTFVFAQYIEDARHLLYNEKYQSADTLLHQVIKNEPANSVFSADHAEISFKRIEVFD